MTTTQTPDLTATPGTDIDQYLAAAPSKTAICDRLDQIEREKKKLKKLLRIATIRESDSGEVSPC
jgi:hypothetical protein